LTVFGIHFQASCFYFLGRALNLQFLARKFWKMISRVTQL